MPIGIFAPYDRREETLMAVRTAELAIKQGYEVSYLVDGEKGMGVHAFWDQKVLTPSRTNFDQWFKKCRQIIWFTPQKDKLQRCMEAKKTNILVALWHNLKRADRDLLRKFDNVVCPSSQCCDQLEEQLDGVQLRHIRWDAGLPLAKRQGYLKPGQIRMYVALDSHTCNKADLSVIYALHNLVGRHDNLRLTVGVDKTFSRHLDESLRALYPTHDDWVIYKPTWQDHIAQLANHDWFLRPVLRANAGLMSQLSLECGTPVICYDVPPLSEFLKMRHNAVLAPCELSYNWIGAPEAMPCVTNLVDVASAALEEVELLRHLHAQPWQLEKRRADFEEAWRKVFDW